MDMSCPHQDMGRRRALAAAAGGSFTFGPADQIVNRATARGQRVRPHHSWDVVTEAFADGGSGQHRPSVFQNLLGDGFIEQAFRTAAAKRADAETADAQPAGSRSPGSAAALPSRFSWR
ncbi:endo-1,4-beta-xylanase [Streptomyces sp. D2-8]|nr:endo-1,4-beta-xylanase [Streptomyces sp. D2-8]